MSIQTVEISLPESIIKVIEIRQGPAGPGGGNSVTGATASDGTADLDLLNVDTVTATVTDTLTANHIHGNLAGSVYAHVRAGETLTKGNPVYVSGSHGSGSTLIPIVSKADASNAAKMPAIGIMDADLANNANGHMVIVGTITELNTTGLTVNAELYVAAGGGLTATPPTARAQPVARVERVNANNGAVIVKVNGLSASDATGNTLVRRTVNGDASFNFVFLDTVYAVDVAADYVVANEYVETKDLTVDNAATFNATTYTYGAGAASAHRIALGAGTTGAELFGAADAAAARTTLGLSLPIAVASGGTGTTNGSITGTGALTFTSAAASNINLTPGTTGIVTVGANSAALLGTVATNGLAVSLPVTSSGAICFSAENRAASSSGGGAFAALYSNDGAALASGDRLGGFLLGGSSSASSLRNAVLIAGFASQTWTDGSAYGAELRFETTSNGATSRTPWMTLGNNGTLSLAATTASTSTTTGALVVSGGVGIAGNINAGGSIAATGTVRTGGYTFATLPTPTQGMRTFITDGAALPIYMANAAGGSNVVTPVFYNGTNWINA
jgi:hypothetical protein